MIVRVGVPTVPTCSASLGRFHPEETENNSWGVEAVKWEEKRGGRTNLPSRDRRELAQQWAHQHELSRRAASVVCLSCWCRNTPPTPTCRWNAWQGSRRAPARWGSRRRRSPEFDPAWTWCRRKAHLWRVFVLPNADTQARLRFQCSHRCRLLKSRCKKSSKVKRKIGTLVYLEQVFVFEQGRWSACNITIRRDATAYVIAEPSDVTGIEIRTNLQTKTRRCKQVLTMTSLTSHVGGDWHLGKFTNNAIYQEAEFV